MIRGAGSRKVGSGEPQEPREWEVLEGIQIEIKAQKIRKNTGQIPLQRNRRIKKLKKYEYLKRRIGKLT